MNTPVEEAASQAVHHVNKVGVAVSWAGNGVAYLTVHQAELQTLAIVLTILYTAWQFGRDFLRDRRDRLVSDAARKVEAWARGQGMRTQPAALTPEERHATSPTPLFDDTFSPDQAHHEGKRQ